MVRRIRKKIIRNSRISIAISPEIDDTSFMRSIRNETQTEGTEAMETNKEDRDRARNGQYQAYMHRICKCGHARAEHDAERATVDGTTYQECHICECSCFKQVRKSKKS